MLKQVAVITAVFLLLTFMAGESVLARKQFDEQTIPSDKTTYSKHKKKAFQSAKHKAKALKNFAGYELAKPQILKERDVLYEKVLAGYFGGMEDVPFTVREVLEKITPEIQQILKKYPKAVVLVEGYVPKAEVKTDRKKLALLRAAATADYLEWTAELPKTRIMLQDKVIHKKNTAKNRKVRLLVVN